MIFRLSKTDTTWFILGTPFVLNHLTCQSPAATSSPLETRSIIPRLTGLTLKYHLPWDWPWRETICTSAGRRETGIRCSLSIILLSSLICS